MKSQFLIFIQSFLHVFGLASNPLFDILKDLQKTDDTERLTGKK
jgi:hypothetical protein